MQHTPHETDAELVQRARRDERDAFACLIERHRTDALRAARASVGEDETAREIVQEATLQAFLSLPQLREPEGFGAWFAGIVRQLCRSHHRRQHNAPLDWNAPTLSTHLPVLPDTALVAQELADREAIRSAIDSLSPALHAAAEHFYLDQLSIREIAAALDVSVGAVKVRLYQARKQLRQTLAARFPERAAPSLPAPRKQKGIPMSSDQPVLQRVELYFPLSVIESKLLPETATLFVTPPTTESDARRFLLAAIASLPPQLMFSVFLTNPEQTRMISLRIGQSHACTVQAALNAEPDNDNLAAYDLMHQLLQQVGTQVESVRIDSLEDSLYFAEIHLQTGDKHTTLHTRPTEGLTLAAHLKKPLSIADPILERDGWDLSSALAEANAWLSADTEVAASSTLLRRLIEGFLHFNLCNRHDDELTVILTVRPHCTAPFEPRLWIDQHWTQRNLSINTPTPMPLVLLPAILACVRRMAGLDLASESTEENGVIPFDFRGTILRIPAAIRTDGQYPEIEFRLPRSADNRSACRL